MSPQDAAVALFRFGLRLANHATWLALRTDPVARSKFLLAVGSAACVYPRGVA